ncbi:UNKNOWN [Stylonychia lemnae]|uniref:Uncharacterized protein n=1 Tax=Stylonychia lemnae TaxID=5949 RepID=A0A078AXT6_STYLE|nr:UNKNOWN [Stylonychia lemnae]|eukprot:CDW86989.1 UNKNOWN [Stylonychia lemnae]
MGNACAGKRDKMDKAGKYTSALAGYYKKQLSESYVSYKEDYREKYEDKMLTYRLNKSRTGAMGDDSYIQYISNQGSGTKFQEILMQFESQFPLRDLSIQEFERRVKKLVYHDEYIYVWQIVECFKTCPGFEDVENSTSLSLSLLTSDFLKRDYIDGSDSGNGQQQSSDQRHTNMSSSLFDRTSEQFATQKIYVPYLILLAILYCKGTPRARATKFYELCQLELTPHVCCLDDELKEHFRKILQLCTLFLTEQFQASYIALAAPEEARAETLEYSRDILFTLQPETLESMVADIFEDFLDQVFVTETRPSKDEFIGKLSNEFAKFLLPCYIRGIVIKKLIKSSSTAQ